MLQAEVAFAYVLQLCALLQGWPVLQAEGGFPITGTLFIIFFIDIFDFVYVFLVLSLLNNI